MNLSNDHKKFIIERLALWVAPKEIIAEMAETFGFKEGQGVTPQQVYNLDPTRPANDKRIAPALRELHRVTREEFLKNVQNIAAANRAVRVKRLQDLAEKAAARGQVVVAAQIYEQIAKEVGDVFTNRTRQDITSGGKRVGGVTVSIVQTDKPKKRDE